MTQHALAPFHEFIDLERMAAAIANSNLFGLKTKEQALGLMLLCQAEGLHPAIAARDYHIVSGRPAKKSEAMLRDFLGAGGKVEWKESTDTIAEATFSHPQGGALALRWDKAKAEKAGLWDKGNWKTYPAAMLRARLISEGVRAVFPAATSGMYVPEEAQDFEPRNVTPITPPAETKPPVVLAPEPKTDTLKADLTKAIHRIVRESELRGDVTTASEVFQSLMEDQRVKIEHIEAAKTPTQIEKLAWAYAKAKALLGSTPNA